jgi:hypothetical protein
MAGKTILLAAMILVGCRGSVREGETASQMNGEVARALPPEQVPLKIDRAGAPTGPCSDRRVAIGRGRLEGVSLRAMDRVAISTDSGGSITSAWRIQAEGEQGSGTIVRVEGSAVRGDYYVGDGIFAGCNQPSLASAYFTLAPPPGAAEFEMLQLG